MRTLIYTCADKKYSHWIPLYCLSILTFNKDVDIEIGMEGHLEPLEKEAVEYIRSQFPNSQILIKENFFTKIGEKKAFVESQNIKTLFVTVRFVTTPKLKADYVYIGDVDIIILEPFVQQHLNNMEKLGLNYSNIVQLKNPQKMGMSGLHFSKWNAYYPLPNLSEIDLFKDDREILKDIISLKGNHINLDATFRPVHGIHFSKNRPTVKGDEKIPGWGADKYRKAWEVFSNTEQYKFVYENTDESIKMMIKMLNDYYKNN